MASSPLLVLPFSSALVEVGRKLAKPKHWGRSNALPTLARGYIHPSSSTEHWGGSNVGIRPNALLGPHAAGPTTHPQAQEEETYPRGQHHVGQ
ncbi:hypothetical protein SLE2022_146940 [Rubroshorea leprosula]